MNLDFSRERLFINIDKTSIREKFTNESQDDDFSLSLDRRPSFVSVFYTFFLCKVSPHPNTKTKITENM